MKTTLILSLFSLFIANVSFAEEVDTECPMMREDTNRNNPKDVKEAKPASSSSSGTSAVAG